MTHDMPYGGAGSSTDRGPRERSRLLTLALALVAVLVPVTIAGAAPAQAADTYYYAHLGDSYAAGPGAGNYAAGAPCWRSNNSYGAVWASQYDVVFSNDSCSGGTTGTVLNSQLIHLGTWTNRITLTVGGNDIGFADIIQACRFAIGNCATANQSARTAATTTLPSDLYDVLATITQQAPNARVILTGYPLPYNATATCNGGVSATDRADINATIRSLNSTLNNATANFSNVYFADVDPNFAGHRLCDSGTRYINDIGTSDWYVTGKSGMYHPTADGHRFGYLPAVAAL